MSNLKKILALVLALVMSFSLVTVSNAAFADLKDTETVSENYLEAVRVLSDMGIFKGDNLGNFNPKAPITREEVAAMMYRVISADVADDFDRLYIEACDFEDGVSSWAKGFVGYCANGGYVKGVGGKNFDPQGNISGIAVLAMALRAVGYDKNNEFTGPEWDKNVLAVATKLGLLVNVDETVVSLGQPATRELVAELIFRTMVEANKVNYTPAFGYSEFVYNTAAGTTTIGVDNFGLDVDNYRDVWGNPGYVWTYDCGEEATVFMYDAVAEYDTAVTECEIAADIKQSSEKTFTLFTNGLINDTSFKVQPTDTVQTLGGQGTHTAVYCYYDIDGAYNRDIVVVDTFLAMVAGVIPATFDARNHLMTPSTMILYVFDDSTDDLVNNTTGVATPDGTPDGYNTILWARSDAKEWEYAAGDFLLLNAWTQNDETACVTGGSGDVVVQAVLDDGNHGYSAAVAAKTAYITIAGTPSVIEGTQTYLWNNVGEHIINDVTYPDAKWFRLDEAGTSTAKHNWLFDENNNLIGVVDIATIYSYGVIEKIQWINPVANYGYAQATIRYMDNTTEDMVIYAVDFNMDGALATTEVLTYALPTTVPTGTDQYVSTTLQDNANWFGADLFRIEKTEAGAILTHVNDGTNKNHTVGADLKTNTTQVLNADNSTIDFLINANTTFLVNKGVAGYALVKGYENIGNYTTHTTGTFDYIDLNGDLYADYVYINAAGDADVTDGMFFLTSYQVGTQLKNGAVDYYTVQGYLNGVATTLKVDAGTTNVYDFVKVLVPNMDPSFTGTMATLNTMFSVHLTNGVVDAAPVAKNAATDLDALLANTAYNNISMAYSAATTTAGTVVLNGTSLKVGTQYFTVAGVTPVFGALTQGDMSGKTVYVLYDHSVLLANTNSYLAKAIYVVDPANGTTNSGSGTVTTPAGAITVNTLTWATNNFVLGYTTPTMAGTETVVITIEKAGIPVVTYTAGTITAGTAQTATIAYPSGGANGTDYTVTITVKSGTTVVAEVVDAPIYCA